MTLRQLEELHKLAYKFYGSETTNNNELDTVCEFLDLVDDALARKRVQQEETD